jgi:hypothetical protein
VAGDAVYVYGIVEAGEALELPEGVDGAAVLLHEVEGVAAIVSRVPDRPVQATRRNVEAHAAVLARALERRDPVLPMRFGVLMPDEGALEAELLRGTRSELENLLRRFAGSVELELKALYADYDSLLEEIVRSSPRVARLRGRASYHEQLELGELVAAALEERRRSDEALLVERLSPLALDWRARGELPERVAAKLSFLVERGRQEALEAEAELLAEELHPQLQLRLDGPLAPHSFVDLELPAGAAA